jgi:hypothetical protein
MIANVDIDSKLIALHDVFVGETYEDIVKLVKAVATPAIVKSQPWYLRGIVKNTLQKMSPADFGKEVVKRYNKEMKESYALPTTCVGFVEWAEAHKFAVMEESQ